MCARARASHSGSVCVCVPVCVCARARIGDSTGRQPGAGGRQLLGDLLGTVLPPQVGTRLASRLSGLERNSPAQSIANKVFIYNGGAFRSTLGCQLSDGGSGDFERDLRSRNRIYWA